MSQRIIAWDLGTSGCKSSLYSDAGECLASVTENYETIYTRPDYHEQRPEDWWNAVCRSTVKLLDMNPVVTGELAGAALSGHSLGVVPIDSSGALIREITPIWSDRRASRQAEEFFKRFSEDEWYRITGNGFARECYPIFKAMWYRDEEPDMYRRIEKLLGTKDYINYRFTGVVTTDYSYASGTGIYSLENRSYHGELIEASGIPEDLWPIPVESGQLIGKVTREAARQTGLPEGLPIACGGVDNSCMALGAANIEDGRVYLSLGSSAWIAVSANQPVLGFPARSFVFDHVVPDLYTSATSIFSAGSSLNWYVRNFRGDLIEKGEQSGSSPYKLLEDEAFTYSPIGSNGVLFNPTLAGGAEGDIRARIPGALSNLSLGNGRADVSRAVLEGIALDLALKYRDLIKRVKVEKKLWIVGGGGRSPRWRQMFADIFGVPIVKGRIDSEAGALGAAALAAVATGLWDDYSPVLSVNSVDTIQNPDPVAHQSYQSILERFERHFYSNELR